MTLPGLERAVLEDGERGCGTGRPGNPQLVDDFVRDREQAGRNVLRQRLGGLEVEHELELCGLNHRHITGLFTFENPSRVDAGLPISISEKDVKLRSARTRRRTVRRPK